MNFASLRPDLDIMDDIHALVNQYPPMRHERHFVEFKVDGSTVVVTGNLRSGITARLLRQALTTIPGVHEVETSALFDDDTIRLSVGQLVPPGVFVNVSNGAIALTGVLPADLTDAQLVERVTSIPGVTRVVTSLS
jgi:osmotically-inducible protein OsmY